jgi:hypothetical protein
MKSTLLAGLVAVTLTVAAAAQEPPMRPKPEKEHEWLKQFVGEWEAETECVMEPGKLPMTGKATSSNKMFGGHWMIAEGQMLANGVPAISSKMTLGYDPAKKKYVGTWVDTVQMNLWTYEGSVDAAGKVLTLAADGPSWTDPTKTAKYKDVFEFKGPDEKVLTSHVQGDDGKWTQFMKATYKRKK